MKVAVQTQIAFTIRVHAQMTKRSRTVKISARDHRIALACCEAGLLKWKEEPHLVKMGSNGSVLVDIIHDLEPAQFADRIKLTKAQLYFLRVAVKSSVVTGDGTSVEPMGTLVDFRLAEWTRGVLMHAPAIKPTWRGREVLSCIEHARSKRKKKDVESRG
jgi:hypothetical protein